ncbi:hypothetical protein PAPYR_8503 [Paratrimastix pyriformis]|uniref:Uncharacterized protein n=1 Tax=Paratrimastix pyriformis TaxID=342808 RepID=A0ABQ8UG63_9EUKA|nr:hypothetical protein PAPYR_8503 [Paratrimastix pyriformis]
MVHFEWWRCKLPPLYLLLIGLSHDARQAIRGTLRQMSFDEKASPDDILEGDCLPTPTADILAALVGPCKGLVDLSLPSREPGLWGCGRTAADYAPWVDAAFAGHIQLATLRVPVGDSVMAALPRILGHLHGLVDFRLFARQACDPDAVLPALGQCPCLEGLHLDLGPDWHLDPTLLTTDSSAPLCTRLKRLSLPTAFPEEDLNVFIRSLAGLERLRLMQCDDETLACVGPHLARLKVSLSRLNWCSPLVLDRLEAITIKEHLENPCFTADLLRANRATLRSVSFDFCQLIGSLFEALAACPVLSRLTLSIRPWASSDFKLSDIPQSLLNQLESFRLRDCGSGYSQQFRAPIDSPSFLASTSLHNLELALDLLHDGCLTPALESLTLPPTVRDHPQGLALRCPQLRQIAGFAGHELAECQAMPRLAHGVHQGHSRAHRHAPCNPGCPAGWIARRHPA